MATSNETIKATYPLPVYNYRVTIQTDSESPVLSFVDVTGLTVEYEPVTYKHGLSYTVGVRIIPGMKKPTQITMRQGITRDRDYLLNWLTDVYDNPDADDKKRNIQIDLCDELGSAVVRWDVDSALPIKWEAPTLSAEKNEVAIASMEWIAHGLRMRFLNVGGA